MTKNSLVSEVHAIHAEIKAVQPGAMWGMHVTLSLTFSSKLSNVTSTQTSYTDS